MMFFRRAIANPGWKNELFASILVTVSFLGGGVEIVYGNFFILLLMILFPSSLFSAEGEGQRKGPWEGILLRGRSLLIVSIGFLLLSAIQLIPFLELFMHSIRSKGIFYQQATIWSFAPKDILLFFLPDAYGYFLDMKRYWVTQCWFKTLYAGGLPFILGSFFFLLGKERKFYISLMVFSLFLSLGGYNPLYQFVFKYLPFFNGIRYPVKFLYIFILVLSIISGLGYQRLVEYSRDLEKKRLNVFILISLASGISLIFLVLNHRDAESFLKLKGFDFPDFNPLSVNLYNAKRFLFYLTLFFLLLRVGHGVKWQGWTKVLLIFFLTADLFGNMGFYGKEKPSDYFQKTRILEIISSDKGHFRVFATAKTISTDTPILIGEASFLNIFKEKHLPSLNLLYRLHDVWGIDVIHLQKVDDLYKALTEASSISGTNITDLYGAKYVISITPVEEDPRFELIYARLEGLRGEKEELLKGNTIKLYRNHNALARSWLVKNFQVLDQKSILAKLASKEFDPRKEVLLEEEPPHPIPLPKGGEGEERGVEFISESNNRLQLLVETKENNILVLSDTYFPGWKVFVDGREEKIYRANYTFRAVPLIAGTHRVEFVYDPGSFKLGAGITFLGIMGCLGLALATGRNKRRLIRTKAMAILKTALNIEKSNTLTLTLLEEAHAYNRWVFEKIKPWLGKHILEVGCGVGNLTGFLLSQGEVIVADMNESYLQRVRDKFGGYGNLKGALIWDIQKNPPQNLNGPIDTIVCSNVLEHVEDDVFVLKNFYQLLPAGERLIVLVPALKMFYNVLDRELGHFRRYNKEEMIQKLTGNGFRICHLTFFNWFGLWGWFVNGTLLKRRLLSRQQIKIFNKMVPFFTLLERFSPPLVGQSLISAAEKI
ncbi:MAG: YfhO family protein [Deltaproteobacteria bacterium]|nr:YfhO family protein [Deltaproteobacteria bacterium]